MSRFKSGLCVLALWLGAGCGAEELPEGDETRAIAAQTDALSGGTFFAARRDTRRCAAPACGGSFVRALNRAQTTCADGTRAPECYVAKLDLSALGLSVPRQQQLIEEQSKVVFVGAIQTPPHARGASGALVVEEAWRGVSDSAAGDTLLTTNSGIVCITTPCPTHTGELVNRSRRFALSPNFSGLKASADDLARIHTALDGQGALLSGRLAHHPHRLAQLGVTQAYLRVATARLCGSRGRPPCGRGEYCQFDAGACGELDHPGICMARPTACTEIYEPVCGCDGRTYGNACQAAAKGVSVDREGPCETACGGLLGKPCPGHGECVFDDPQCADCTGVCRCSGAAVLCGPGDFFDDDPAVCSCVPSATGAR